MIEMPEDFTRRFAQHWMARDVAGLVALMSDDAEMLTLTGAWCEGRAEIEAVLTAELQGAFARSRMVTGKKRLRPLGPGAAVLVQRFVLSGLVDADGRDAGRIGAVLSAVLIARRDGWQATMVHFTGLAE